MSKRAPIDLSALAEVAQPHPDPVAAVVSTPITRRAAEPAKRRDVDKRAGATPAQRQASRMGKVGIQLWVAPDVRQRLKLHSVTTGRTLDDLLSEAVADFMRSNKIA